jgi:hypothetical protein
MTAARPEGHAVNRANHKQDRAPPDIRMQAVEHNRGFGGWIQTPAAKISAPFTKSETPIKNQIEIMCIASVYQKMMLRMKKTTTTIAAQKSGFW